MKKILLFTIASVIALIATTSCIKNDDPDPEPTYYTVLFDTQGGSAVKSEQVLAGGHATRPPANPTKLGYLFANWYRDRAGTVLWDFANDVVNSNVTIHAKWNLDDDGELAGLLSELENGIAVGDALSMYDYTTASWDPFADALAEAKTVFADGNSTAADVQEAIDKLQDAYDKLVPIKSSGGTSSKNALEAAITVAEALPSYAYTSASWMALEEALAAAEGVDANPNATQADVDNALEALNQAVEGLVPNSSGGGTGGGTTPPDKAQLNARISAAGAYVEADYTAASWMNFETALAAAQKISVDPTASQAEINAALGNLNKAIAGLDHVTISDPGTDPNVDRSALGSFITDSDKLVQNDYTTDSWATFAQALNAAKQVYNNTNSTQTQVDDAYATLQTAVNDLVHAQDSGLVRDLINQLTSLVNSLPSASMIKSNPLLVATTIPVAILADTVRDQLNPLLGGVDNTVVDGLNRTLDGILQALGLTSLI